MVTKLANLSSEHVWLHQNVPGLCLSVMLCQGNGFCVRVIILLYPVFLEACNLISFVCSCYDVWYIYIVVCKM